MFKCCEVCIPQLNCQVVQVLTAYVILRPVRDMIYKSFPWDVLSQIHSLLPQLS